MKTLLLAPALVSFVNTDLTVQASDTKPVVTELVAIATVQPDRPIVEVPFAAPEVPIVAQEEDNEKRLQGLKAELEKLAANLQETQRTVDDVAQQRDQAREEVRALAKANHEMLTEMKTFREEIEVAGQETEKWKARAQEMELKANAQASVIADMQKFREELQGTMEDFRAMKADFAQVRTELQDPIERANLKEQLAEAQTKQARLGDEIEMALIAREKTILDAARTKKELEGKMETLLAQAQEANVLRDELRSTNAEKMKALADVEVLGKTLQNFEEAQAVTLAELKVAQDGLLALQAEKAAAVEARMVANQERDQALAAIENLRGQIEEVHVEAEASKQAVAQMTEELKELEAAREATGQELAEATGTVEKVKEEVVFLTKAKGGLEELLFKKTAEIRQLKGELRKVQAANEEPSGPPQSPESEGKEESALKPEIEIEPETAQALADD